jgi:Outer membrane protein beta-barrel domain
MKWTAVPCVLTIAALFSTTANAQEPVARYDLFAGYSYVRANPSDSRLAAFNVHGGSASVGYNVNAWLSTVADFGGYHSTYRTPTDVDGTFLFGPRISYRHFRKLTPFGQVLFGLAHNTNSGQTSFATSFGAGLDYRLSQHMAIRTAQVDWLLTRFDEFNTTHMQNNLRVSTGIVFRF